DDHLSAVLYTNQTKAHNIVKLSLYEIMFGLPPPSIMQDPLQMLGRSLGFEWLANVLDK
ncbi:hypothetical protein BD560DRAFT_306147, partial [Blakeslea trispora]